MIRVDRTAVPEPASLSKKLGGSGPFSGMTEAERVASQFASHVAAGGDPAEFRFDYKRYKEPDVKRALETLFGGKCAYCESRYAGTQPLDVEHWRPKSEVHERDANGDEVVLPGYHWLAVGLGEPVPVLHRLQPPAQPARRAHRPRRDAGQGEPVPGGRAAADRHRSPERRRASRPHCCSTPARTTPPSTWTSTTTAP